jgi:glucose uptake protein GlcU
MLGSITLLSAKIIAEIVKSASLGNPEFSKFSTYFFIFLIFALGAAQIHVLNLGLRKFDQIVVIPVFSVSLETFSILVGILYFEEYRNFSLTQALLFPVAIAITFIGVYITAKGQKEQDEQDENSKYIADAVPMPVDNQGIEVKE